MVSGKVEVSLLFSYSHPDWETASYDSEGKVLLPHGDVSGEKEIELSEKFSMTIILDKNGTPDEIEDLSLRISDWIWLSVGDHWIDYK